MERQIMTEGIAREILSQLESISKARIYQGNTSVEQRIQKITIDLSTARLETNPLKVNFPFRSVYVETYTDVLSNVFLKPETEASIQSSFKLRANDSWASDYPISNANIFWDAQSGKSITLIFFRDSVFSSGSQVSVTGGGVSIVEGSTIGAPTSTTLAAGVAAAIAPQNLLRKTCTIENKTGASLYVGDSTVTNAGATEGIIVPAGGQIKWRNTAAIYGYSVAGGKVTRIEEE